ncbi:hypothetical protein ACLBKU_03665 [Erythrobacter sp. NE805]|uniref:hypothetical protein n=1 Tax=Erythrobacter sp. NE805 TaxID=3389875 RepID=UPI00396B0A31
MLAAPRLALACAALLAAPGTDAQPIAPAEAPRAALPETLVLAGENLVTVTVNGVPLRFEVSAEAFGPPVVNPAVAARLMLVPEAARGWRFGPVVVEGHSASALADFGAGPAVLTLAWSDRTASEKADGVIGVHHLPHARVTFAFHAPAPGETIERFALKRAGGRGNTRLGTEVAVGKKRLMMIFVPERRENLVTAPTANFIATHREGGFEPGSDGVAVMDFGVERPTRMMRIADPIALGSLALERFAVRVEDYGAPRQVGEIARDDPRFDRNGILVSRRRGRGRPDLLTRIGSDQLAHCSSLTYDLAGRAIELSCAPPPG